MDPSGLLEALILVSVAMYIIKHACDSFEGASDYLGTEVYEMKPGIRGATLEAIASSLPELFTTAFLLFIFRDTDGFSAGIATCAGSAVFNAAVIPAVCILAVCYRGVNGQKVESVTIRRKTILRDGVFFVLAEVALIVFLGGTTLAWWMGAALMGIYALYFCVLLRGFGSEDGESTEDDPQGDDANENEKSFAGKLLTFDYNELFFGGRDFTSTSAWVVLALATLTIGGACFALTHAIEGSADALGVPMYFTAVILGAAATSVPDTFISYKDAMKGDYDDAVANAVGSNIFDICIALGLPLLAYGLFYGNVELTGELGQAANIQELRIALILVTVIILGLFLTGKTSQNNDGEKTVSIGPARAWVLGSLYLFWTAFIVGRAMEWPWLANIVS